MVDFQPPRINLSSSWGCSICPDIFLSPVLLLVMIVVSVAVIVVVVVIVAVVVVVVVMVIVIVVSLVVFPFPFIAFPDSCSPTLFGVCAKGLTSPEQTATGKGISNPLMAVMVCQKPYGIQLTNVSRVNTPGSDENRLKLYDLMYKIFKVADTRVKD
ncbi:hypothetical protein Tco_0937356 [Tanacetum coccineum]|uniref:Uncharacterized protein n=1 Tax=Tanacetum coccineum TaxID=301880 RepID=A0ABQ5DE29_9ASTR